MHRGSLLRAAFAFSELFRDPLPASGLGFRRKPTRSRPLYPSQFVGDELVSRSSPFPRPLRQVCGGAFIGMGGLGLTKDGGLTKSGGGALTGGMRRAGCCVGSGSANNVGGGAFVGPGAGGASGGVGGGEGT